jgi:hypothetical protein
MKRATLLAAGDAMTPSDELWHEWKELDRLIGDADDKAWNEAGGEFDLYKDRRQELWAPIFERLDEVEEKIASIIPTTVRDCLAQIRLLKARWDCEPSELDDLIVDNMLAGLEAMAANGV